MSRTVAAGALFTFLIPAICAGQAPGSTGAAAAQAPALAAAPATQIKPGQPTASSTPLEAEGFTYNSEGRRDPFVSPLRRGPELQHGTTDRVAGFGGLRVGEVTLKGTFASRGGYLAILQGSDEKSYIVRTGERLLDGTIRSITANAVLILQHVNDPLSPESEREVRKVLRQTEEAK